MAKINSRRAASAQCRLTRLDGIAITVRPISELKLNPQNPRAHSPRQIRQLAESIRTFGFNVPILLDTNSQVIAGHGRVLAARRLGLPEVPTIRLSHLSEAQAQAFTIADNRLTENSTWDDKLLAEQLKALSLLHLDFSLEVVGFDTGEIDLRIESLEGKPDVNDDPADQIPAIRRDRPVSRVGDHWMLDRHRILCGNALDETAYALLLEGKRANVAFTDPPYNLSIATGLGKPRHKEFLMAAGEMDSAAFIAFLTSALSLQARYSRKGSIHFICMDWRHLAEMLAAGGTAYAELLNLCVWTKTNGGMGSLYRSQHELIFVFKRGGAPHRNNVQLGQYGRNRTNVWCYAATSSLSRSGEEGDLLALHPTVKPVALVADAILDCSARGDIVLDPFVGSGTTIMAAERTGRCGYALELDPAYVDTAIRRWQKYTGGKARHAETGQGFDEFAGEKEHRHG